jgi:hypothetical protein
VLEVVDAAESFGPARPALGAGVVVAGLSVSVGAWVLGAGVEDVPEPVASGVAPAVGGVDSSGLAERGADLAAASGTTLGGQLAPGMLAIFAGLGALLSALISCATANGAAVWTAVLKAKQLATISPRRIEPLASPVV